MDGSKVVFTEAEGGGDGGFDGFSIFVGPFVITLDGFSELVGDKDVWNQLDGLLDGFDEVVGAVDGSVDDEGIWDG